MGMETTWYPKRPGRQNGYEYQQIPVQQLDLSHQSRGRRSQRLHQQRLYDRRLKLRQLFGPGRPYHQLRDRF